MKLWDKGGVAVENIIDAYTVGQDRDLDIHLAPYDVLGSIAHVKMLSEVGLIPAEEAAQIVVELQKIHQSVLDGQFEIEDSVEDVHSQVEFLLTEALGDLGKKVHAARSRNDQVLVDMKMYLRAEVEEIVNLSTELITKLLQLSDQHKDVIIPGYTHLQVAMPSSFGLWFSAFAESLIDDLRMLQGAYDVINQNPLGSAAGYGSSFPIDRELTSRLLGFAHLHYNVVAAQMSRGKSEQSLAFGMASIGQTLGRWAMDICLYNSQNFGFLSFPDHLTTGSSIMPHKKNPDVFEIMRGKMNQLQNLPQQLMMLTTNLPSGYHREFQLLKEVLLPAIFQLKDSLSIAKYMMENVQVNKAAIEDKKYEYMYSVESVNAEVMNGLTFRDAYIKVGQTIEKGEYVPQTEINHSHQGSIGNLCNREIEVKLFKVRKSFNFDTWHQAFSHLLQ
ncbi:argininosuccinate lyase [Persicobacter psychrovividus]|uniref:Argininosuccinate lyase n=1 Tax=Persicobacter psychrovividus TaxID=387638 RepID=A0ABN6LEP5_9BACT|nr:argininosuccinate lyase [Persicobacter psychrovividus]